MARYKPASLLHRRMAWDLEQTVKRDGIPAIWTPATGAPAVALLGIFSPVSTSLARSRFGDDLDYQATYTVARTSHEAATDWALGGALQADGSTYRIQRVDITRIAIIFALGDAAA